MRPLTAWLLVATASGVGAPATASARVVGHGSPHSCTSAAVVAAVRAGGTIRFDCGRAPVTIHMRQTAEVHNTSRTVVLDGGGRVTLDGGGRRRILYMNTCDRRLTWTTPHCEQQPTPRLVVDGLTFSRGDSTGDGATGGGAIFALGGGLLIEHSRFVGDRCAPASGAAVGGGAVSAQWQDRARPATIVDSAFVDDVCGNPGAGGGGGAVFESQGGLDVIASTFTGDRCAAVGPDVGGGAIRVLIGTGAPVRVQRDTFTGNVCSNGGALSSIAASWTVTHSTFASDHAIGDGANPARSGTPGGGSGGAIYNDGDRMHLTIDDTVMEHDTAREGGGAIFFVSDDRTGTMSIAGSRLIDDPSAGFQTPGLPGIFFEGARRPTITRSVLRPPEDG